MVQSNSLLLKNVTIYGENTVTTNGFIYIKNRLIEAIGTEDEWKSYVIAEEQIKVINGKGLNAIPGFIDGHIHGANGADVMDATPQALDTMASALPMEGTTSFLATTITMSKEKIEKALQNVASYVNKPGKAEVVGVHLEGPFIEEKKAGAQPREHIMKPDVALFDQWQKLSGNSIKTVTLAPEIDQEGEVIHYLHEQGVNVSAGHTDAGIEQMKQAVSKGVTQVTHLCNAMSGLHHRDIGVVGAAFLLKGLRSELIADGIHVSPEMIQLIYQNIGSSRLLLITDALRAKCLEPGTYELGGQQVSVTEDRATLPDGTLAGSTLKMLDGVRNMMTYTDASIKDIIKMAAVNPAKQVGIFDKKGSIAVKKDADILLIDDHWTIRYTICRGEIAYKEE
ncbi:N-acetylglucosamine-6-phosphate deacetylase [Aquibacillus sp. 3ASR75-11]|uniref:N-acetylglucosamine-6-phosphate deacetylase n=1 Tax=Terrihalobacillus insolitus TaxID=2950438 RepID=A0A9X3WSM9_9BACI|nr:N-acetylglucosamine-6-phosphate deacetylase [Terrihalobacillus insolitus]MDC3412215.1 N-acetylglucosamine-6-phosphate deacetylase [Terrihalobacillus insolitus]MDC3423091.1 N-acetylglucosamine-6-phosphate deacetylase [Terrihalobacillus insolitus]